MADQELPEDYDAIILGTGMTECIIAAALSRIGWKVLHLDRYDYYSGDWATFTFDGLLNWVQYNKTTNEDGKLKAKEVNISDILKEGERNVSLCINSNNISNVKEFVYVSEGDENVDTTNDAPKKNGGEISKDAGDNDSAKVTSEINESEQKETIANEINAEATTAEVTAVTAETTAETTAEVTAEVTKETGESEKKQELEKEEAKETKNVKDIKDIKDQVKKWTYKEIKKNYRKFCIDLAPRILYCRGPMVELLISSEIAKYCTFRNITRVLTQLNGKLEQVPCSRSDVFSSKQVSMIEKRMLMKLLTFALEFEKQPQEYADYADKPFSEFLKSKKLSANVQHYVHTAIAMATEKTSTLEGLQATQKFLQSLGRYGNTAFLWPLYGSGELPQCFCRMCAVFGGIYCLRRSGTQLLIDSDNKCSGIVDTEGQRLNAKYIVMETSFASKELLPSSAADQGFISRAILLTDRSILPSDKDQISLLCLPPVHENGSYITIYELSQLSLACPKDIFVVQISCRGIKGAEEDLRPTVESLFSLAVAEDGAKVQDNPQDNPQDKPQVLWSLFYEQKNPSNLQLPENAPEGVFVVPSADLALDFDEPIRLAREIFEKLCPGEEFLPKAPNPEDIVFEDNGEGTEKGSGFYTSESPKDEQSTDEKTPSDVQETPFENNETPSENKETPSESIETPSDNKKTSTEIKETPSENMETPSENIETPSDRKETPSES